MTSDLEWIVSGNGGNNLPATGGAPSVQLAVGHAVEWHEPGLPSFHLDIPHTYATREIVSAPGSAEMDAIGSQTPWEVMRAASTTLLSSAAFVPGCDALEVRYTTTPAEAGPSRIRMFLTAMVRDWTPVVAEAALEAACAALPRGFTWATPQQELPLGRETSDSAIIELRRHEEVTEPEWDYIPATFYYTVNDDPGDGSGWTSFWRAMSESRRAVTVSLLFMQTDIHPQERHVLGGIISNLALLAETRTEMNYIYQVQETIPGCENAKLALASWHKRLAQLQRPLLARVAVRGDVQVAAPIATVLASAIGMTGAGTGAASHPMYLEVPKSLADARQAAFGFDWLEIIPWGGSFIWEHAEAPMSLRRLPYLFGLHEAGGLALLPVPDTQGVPGMPRARRAARRRAEVLATDTTEPGLRMGSALHYGDSGNAISLPLTAVNRHSLIVGASGSGKTTTVLSMLAELWREHRIPFLVIEPTKKEYRSLLETPGFEDLRVVCLGRDDVAPLRLNPLAPPPGVRREVHANAVLASLKLALPLQTPLPQLLDEAIDWAYQLAGWDYDTTSEAGLRPPTLRSLRESFDTIFARKGYQKESDAQNIGVAFGVRLDTLLRGSRGRVLDTVESVDFGELMLRPVIVELDEISDNDDKAIFASFLLDRLRGAAKARGSSEGLLKHVTVIEEAHRLLARANGMSTDGTGDNARADTVKAFCDAIAELRSVGEGFVLSTQNPSDLARVAISNTATRIVHRLEDAGDRDAVLDDLAASQLDRDVAARLNPGEAIVRWPGRDEAELIKVQAAAGVNSARPVTNESVTERMSVATDAVRRLLPYALCTIEVCTKGCVPERRAEGQQLAAGTGPIANRIWNDADKTVAALDPIVSMLAKETDHDSRATYCAAVHLAVNREAFNVQRRVDIRPQLIKAVERS